MALAEIETNAVSRLPQLARAGRRIFGRRILVGLSAVVVGILVVRPHNPFGEYANLGMAASCGLVLLGLGLRAWGAASAGGHTRSSAIEAPQLATDGPYAYVRNPIYLGSFVLGLGMVGLIGDLWLLAPHLMVFAVFFGSIVRAEEEFLAGRFGSEYERYRRAVPRFFPAMRPWPGRTKRGLVWSAAGGEAYIATLLLLIYGAFRAAAIYRAGIG